MTLNYQFENVVCYMYLLTLLTNLGVYTNSVAAGQTSPISLICIYTNKQQKRTVFIEIGAKGFIDCPRNKEFSIVYLILKALVILSSAEMFSKSLGQKVKTRNRLLLIWINIVCLYNCISQ